MNAVEDLRESAELMRMDVPSVDGEYVEAEVIDDDGGDEPERRHGPRFLRPMTVFFLAVFVVSMVGGFVGGGALHATTVAVDALVAQFVGDGGEDADNPAAEVIAMGVSAVTADGLRIRCAGWTTVEPKAENDEPMVVVAMEVQNVGDEKVVLRKSQFAAIGANGKVVEPVDQAFSRGDETEFYQFASVSSEPGDRFTIRLSFYEATDPKQVLYRSDNRSRGYNVSYTAFEIGGAQETVPAQ